MEQPAESGDVSIRNLGGLNQRVAPLDLPINEFPTLQGYYPSQKGLLSRIPGKEKLFQLEGRVLSIHPTYNSSGHVLIQTDQHLYLTTLDEIQGREVESDLTLNLDPDPGGVSTGDVTSPTSPSNLVASDIASGSLRLTWTASTDNVGVTGYVIYYRTGAAAFAVYATVATNSSLVTGLTASTAYDFYAVATDAAGNLSAASDTLTETTLATSGDVTAPTVPANLLLVSSTTTILNVSWDESTDAVGVTGYIVYLRLGTSGAFAQVGSVASNAFSITGLVPNTTYNIQVTAYDAAGNVSAASTTLSAITQNSGSGNTPTAAEVILYYIKTAGANGDQRTSSSQQLPLNTVSVPVGKSSFLISITPTTVSMPAGTYALELIVQHYSTATSCFFFNRITTEGAVGFPPSDSQKTPSTDLIKTTRSSVVLTLSQTTVVSVTDVTTSPSTTLDGFAVNLGEQEVYAILKISKIV